MNPEVKLDVSANNEFCNQRITRKGTQINFSFFLKDFMFNLNAAYGLVINAAYGLVTCGDENLCGGGFRWQF